MIADTIGRPWAPPAHRWMIAMRWHDLLFMHWPVPKDALRALIPRPLNVDLFEGEAWIGVVPFHMTGVRPRYVPNLPWLSAFPELNVRTYVTKDGKPGVWFFSLDAANPVAVQVARRAFHLPYFHAEISLKRVDGTMRYASRRVHSASRQASFRANYRPIGKVYLSDPGTIDRWLTARYCLYATDRRGRIWRSDIHHVPWPLQPAEAEIETNSMTLPLGITLPRRPPLLHFASRIDAVAWKPQRVIQGG